MQHSSILLMPVADDRFIKRDCFESSLGGRCERTGQSILIAPVIELLCNLRLLARGAFKRSSKGFCFDISQVSNNALAGSVR
jgi:hypothetical protein